jgi:hypothetical protein
MAPWDSDDFLPERSNYLPAFTAQDETFLRGTEASQIILLLRMKPIILSIVERRRLSNPKERIITLADRARS